MVTELMGQGDVEGVVEQLLTTTSPQCKRWTSRSRCAGPWTSPTAGASYAGTIKRKPGDVWLTSDGVAKIGDFGLAVSLDRSPLPRKG